MTKKDYIAIGTGLAKQYQRHNDKSLRKNEHNRAITDVMIMLENVFENDNALFSRGRFEEFVIAKAQE